ncbi:MAG: hypothetical protein ABI904_02930 [Chloroflexota bacterium]
MNKRIYTILAMLAIISFSAACSSAQPTNSPSGTNTAETSSAVTSTAEMNTSVTPSAFTGTVADLIALVNQYVNSGDITGNAENGLLAKLDTIQQKILNGQGAAAANEFGAFINEVQAQQGKKISTTAANAMITAAQQIIANTLTTIPVTGVTATVVPATVAASIASSTPGSGMPVTPMGNKAVHEAAWDLVANDVAKSVGFTTFSYDLYRLPANSAWLDTLAYYDAQAAAAGWGTMHSQASDIPSGHFAVWKLVTNGVANYLVVVQLDTLQGSYTLNIYGK